MSRLARLGRDSLVYGVLDAANRFVGIFLVPLYTRVLSPADYGGFDLVNTLVAVAYTIFALGLDSALSFYYNAAGDGAPRRRAASTAMYTWVAVTLVGALLLVAARGPVSAVALPEVPRASYLLLLAALSLPLQAVTQVQMLVLRLRFSFRGYAVLSLGLLLTTVALNAWFVLYQGRGVEGILLAQLWARGLLAVVGLVVTRGDFAPGGDAALARRMVRYGAPLVLGNLSFWLVVYLERFALLRFATLADVGLFGVATRVATFVTLVSMAIDMAWVPFALSIHREPDAPVTYARALTWYLLLAGLAGTVLAVFAHDALVVLTTPQYYPAHVLVAPIVAALVLRGAFNIVAIGAFVRERTKDLSAISLATAGAHLLLLLALVPALGAMGAAAATLAARVLGLAVLHLRIGPLYPVPYAWGRIARMAAVFAAAAVAGTLLASQPLWVSLAAKGLLVVPLMLAALWLAGAVPRGELADLSARFRARRAGPAAAPVDADLP